MAVRRLRTPHRFRSSLKFFQEFLRNPDCVCSILPSSPVLERRLASPAILRGAQSVVELGPGTGGTTQALLNQLPPSTRFLCIEVNPVFVQHLRCLQNPRLEVHQGSAADLKEILAQYNFPAPDVIISGIPFSAISPVEGRRIIDAVHSELSPGGTFVAYQVRCQVAKLAREPFGKPSTDIVIRNIPPLRIYRWRKQTAAPAIDPIASLADAH